MNNQWKPNSWKDKPAKHLPTYKDVKFLELITKKLSNPNFIKRAPEKVVENEKQKQKEYQNNLDKLVENLSSIKV